MTFTKGLTSAEIRSTPLPVSGTVAISNASVAVTGQFYQTTQPVSGSVSVSNFPATQPVSGTVVVSNFPATQPVSIATMPSTPVTGTFWQATQPISGNVGVTGSVAVTGTFFQTTQPVSAASLPLPAGAATETTIAALNTKTPALGQGLMAASQPVVIASNQSNIPVAVASALPAGTNMIGRTGDATDLNRVTRNFLFNTPTAAPAAEALQSVTQWYNNAAVATTTTPAVVPAGKTLRVTGLRVNTASLAAAGMVVLRIRANLAGVAVIGSPLVASLQCGSQAAVPALQDWQIINFPEGIDFPSGTGLGFTLQGYVGATGTLQSFTTFEVWGYEYTT